MSTTNSDLTYKIVRARNKITILKADQPDDLENHREQWDALLGKDPCGLPTSSYAWISAYFRHCLPTGENWLCFFAYRDDELVGVLPLILHTSNIFSVRYSTYQLPKDNHTIAVYPVLRRGTEAETFEMLLKAAWNEHPEALWMELPDTPENVKVMTLVNRHLHTISLSRIGRYLPVNGNREVYLSSLSRNFRSNQRKAANKLKKLDNVETRFILSGEASSKQLSEFMPVEADGWKGRKGTAIQQSETLVSFYHYLTNELAAAGWLEWHFLYAEGHAIAANLAIRLNRSVVVWKLGYKESYSRCSPGGMLFQTLLDNAFDDPDIDELNLLTDAEWYNNWKMENRKYYNIRLYNPGHARSLFWGYIPNSLINLLKKCKKLISRQSGRGESGFFNNS